MNQRAAHGDTATPMELLDTKGLHHTDKSVDFLGRTGEFEADAFVGDIDNFAAEDIRNMDHLSAVFIGIAHLQQAQLALYGFHIGQILNLHRIDEIAEVREHLLDFPGGTGRNQRHPVQGGIIRFANSDAFKRKAACREQINHPVECTDGIFEHHIDDVPA